MATLQPTDMVALIDATRAATKKEKVTDIGTDLTDFVVLPKLISENQVVYDGGDQYEFRVSTSNGANHKNIGMLEPDNFAIQDALTHGTVEWTFDQWAVLYDIKEKALNSGNMTKILDVVKLREAQEEAGYAEMVENQFWVNEATSDSNNKAPFGLDYWVCSQASGYTDIDDHDFIGGDPSGFASGAAGLAVADYPNWQNYAGNYTTVNKADLVKKMRRASDQTDFVSPLKFGQYDEQRKKVEARFSIYVNQTTKEGLEEIGEAGNDNIGRDIAPYQGGIAFNGNMINYIPKLNDVSKSPVYMINWSTFQFAVQKLAGQIFKKSTRQMPLVTDGIQTVVECAKNLVCHNRRKNVVFTTE